MMLVLEGQHSESAIYRALLGVDELFFIAQDTKIGTWMDGLMKFQYNQP